MRTHTQAFKNGMIELGRELSVLITYGNTTLTNEDLVSVKPNYETQLLKSIMIGLDIQSIVDIPVGTEINFKWGIKVNGAFEYLDYGNYTVYSNERKEDTNTYEIVAYDGMLASMKEYTGISAVYPITIQNYLSDLATDLGWTYTPTQFTNYSNLIDDVWVEIDEDNNKKSLGYTYRDVLDDIAEATATNIVVKNGELLLITPTQTNEIIPEDFVKTTLAKFSTYGPINAVVLSRSSEDNIYARDIHSIEANGLCEIKIRDNQILNNNDRSNYITGIYDALHNLTFTLCDYTSVGIGYFEPLDMYSLQIGDTTYNNLIMLNDELTLQDGIIEKISTDEPSTSETDYTKADTTDIRINQTNLIVDKQNKIIQSLVSDIGEQDEKISQIEQTANEIEAQVSNMYNATKTVRGNKTIVLPKCIKGYLLKLRILGDNNVFDRLYPSDDLYPSDTLYPKGDSRIVITDKNGNQTLYELRVPSVLRANADTYDEYILDNNYAKVIRRVNPDGTSKPIPTEEIIGIYTIYVEQDTNTIEIQNYNGILEATYVEQNSYTDQFATKIEMNSSITQTAEEINTEVRKKVGNDEVISKINQSAEAVTILANKLGLTADDVINLIAGNLINLTSNNISINSNNFSVDSNGNMSCSNANVSGDVTSSNVNISGGNITLNDNGNWQNGKIKTESDNQLAVVYSDGIYIENKYNDSYLADFNLDSFSISAPGKSIGGSVWQSDPYLVVNKSGSQTIIYSDRIVSNGTVYNSKESIKKNIKLYDKKALDFIKNSEIYEYNYKYENDGDKKHIGFVIPDKGGKYKTPDEVMSKDKEGIEQYNVTSILWKAVQEQQEIIEQMQNEIKELKEGK